MQLSLHADYALRVLIYTGAHAGQTVTTAQIAQAYGISRNHLVRVVHTLAERGYLTVTQGRSGGLTLGCDPAAIRLGDVIRAAEPNLRLVECFDRETNTCPIVAVCSLKALLRDALNAFLNDLDRHTLADLLAAPRSRELSAILVQLGAPGQPSPRDN